MAEREVTKDILKAIPRGESALAEFTERLTDGEGFSNPIKRLKLKAFTSIKKSVEVMKKN